MIHLDIFGIIIHVNKNSVNYNILVTEAVTEPGCTDTWTDWLNVTHPNKDGGDFELIKNIEKEGIQICSNNGYIKDVVCKFYKLTHGKFTPW